MKKLVLFSSLLSILSVSAIDLGNGFSLTGDAYGTYQSAYVPESGVVFDKNPVFQMGADLYLNKDNWSLYAGGFANYCLDSIPSYYTKESCWGEADFMIGGYYYWNNFTFGLTFERWEYPNMFPGGHIQYNIHPYVSYKFKDIIYNDINWGHFTLIFDPYFYLGNDVYGYKVDFRPKLDYDVSLYKIYDHDLMLKLRVGGVGRVQSSGYPNGWNSVFSKVQLSYWGFYVWYQHWFQCDSDTYSDWCYEQAHNVVGVGYKFEF